MRNAGSGCTLWQCPAQTCWAPCTEGRTSTRSSSTWPGAQRRPCPAAPLPRRGSRPPPPPSTCCTPTASTAPPPPRAGSSYCPRRSNCCRCTHWPSPRAAPFAQTCRLTCAPCGSSGCAPLAPRPLCPLCTRGCTTSWRPGRAPTCCPPPCPSPPRSSTPRPSSCSRTVWRRTCTWASRWTLSFCRTFWAWHTSRRLAPAP
mmetsp:Transcript_37580/g.106133  ORF Transcript_37580/g.106133 Transcript_37580/m.106133 type:complete len:201 (-) Transcript_37580:563-1165(-)